MADANSKPEYVRFLEKKGLTKLIEECGELIQVAAKKQAFMDLDDHPDQKGSLKLRLEEEIADVAASMKFVVEEWKLDGHRIQIRNIEKLEKFRKYREPT